MILKLSRIGSLVLIPVALIIISSCTTTTSTYSDQISIPIPESRSTYPTTSPTQTTEAYIRIAPLPSSTIMPTGTATHETTIHKAYRERCLEITDLPQGELNPDLSIITVPLEVIDGRIASPPHVQNSVTGEIIELAASNENLIDLSVSPDNKLLAYRRVIFSNGTKYEIISTELIVRSSDGEIVQSIPYREDWGRLAGWLDNEHLIIDFGRVDPDENAGRKAPTLLKINPFTGEEQLLPAAYPEMYDVAPIIVNWDGTGLTSYSPTMENVVYLAGSLSAPGGYRLWDLDDQNLIAEIDLIANLWASPHWASDGSSFVFAAQFAPWEEHVDYELHQVFVDGEIRQLTSLSDIFPFIYIEKPNVSPDGSQIAYWSSTWEEEPDRSYLGDRRLGIYNFLTGMVTDFCIGGEIESTFPSLVPEPIWSSDSRMLMIENQDSHYKGNVVIVDLKKERAYQIEDDARPIGWFPSVP